MTDAPPIILTLALDEASAAFFHAQRQRYFPPARNIVPAHLTLFHHLPGGSEAQIEAALASLCANMQPLALEVSGLRFLGRGVAYEITSQGLTALRARCAALWADWLTPQDRQGFRPHVTVQNKEAPAKARALYEALREGFAPFPAEGRGLQLWRYLDGPWERRAFLGFGARTVSDTVESPS